MRINSKSIYHIFINSFLAAFIFLSQATYAQQGDAGGKSNKETFYEATRFKIQGDFDKAEDLYKKCIQEDPGDAAAMYELAEIYRRRKQNDQALNYAIMAVENDHTNKWYKFLLIQLYQSAGEYDKAESIISMLIEEDPEYLDYYQDQALNHLYAGNYKEAIKTYNVIEEKIGVSEHISIQKEKIYLLMNKPDKAINEIEILSETYPYESRYLEILAELYMTGQMYEEALAAYQKILKIDPENAYINISLSDYYRKQGDEEKAYEYLKSGFHNPNLSIDTKVQILLTYYTINQIYNDLKDEAFELAELLIEAHPDEAKAYSIYADLLYQDKRFSEARDAFRKVISIDSSKYLVWEQLLFVESELNDPEAMADESARAISMFPQQPLLYLFSGLANVQLDNYEKAVEDLNTGVNFVVGNNILLGQFYAYLGDVYFQLDDHEKSDDNYDRALRIDPANTIVLNNYAYYLSLRGEKLAKAEKMAKKAVELDPENSANMDTYGWVLYKLEKYEEARTWIGLAIEQGEPSGVLLEHFGDVLFKLGDKEGALDYWKKAEKKGEGSELLEKKLKDETLYE